MKARKVCLLGAIAGLAFLFTAESSFGQVPPGRLLGSTERAAQETKTKQAILNKLFEGKKKEQIEGEENVTPQAPAQPIDEGTRVLINSITVEGVTAFKPETISAITAPYEGKELSLRDFNDMTTAITDLYRSRGYVTSVAYLIPQKIENNTLRIAVAEGKLGNISVSGNKYFSDKLLMRYLDVKKDELFNYDVLRKDINYINEHPDRNASVVLVKGAAPETTDIDMKVEDRMPFHINLGYNNYNSQYLNRNKFMVEAKATNVWGRDHVVSGEFQIGATGLYKLYAARYLMPFDSRLKMGASYIHVDQKLGGSVKDLEIKGDGDMIGLFYTYKWIDSPDVIMNTNVGFDYKEINNRILGDVYSRDSVRIAKAGFDLDIADMFYGRNIITQEFDFGLPEVLGGLKRKDSKASRAGAGGQFFRSVTNAARVQTLPADLALMLKGSMQLTSDTLVASEQYNIGGFSTVRGYPVSEYAGDTGFSTSGELYVPPYFIPKDMTVPFTKTSFYDALRLMVFFDWGLVHNNNPQVGESTTETLYSFGPAVRFDIPERMSVSFDYGFGIGQKASDGKKNRFYVEVRLFF